MGGGGTGSPVGPVFGIPKPKGGTGRVKPTPKGIWLLGKYARAKYETGGEQSVEFEVREGPKSEEWHVPKRTSHSKGGWRWRWTWRGKQRELRSGRLFAFLQYGEEWRRGEFVL